MKNIKNIIQKRFPNTKFKKIILFKNPNECNHIDIERINPDHIGIIWGKRQKKLKKGSNPIQIGKVYFEIVAISYGLGVVSWLDMFTGYVYGLLASISILTVFSAIFIGILYWGTMLKVIKKCSVHSL